ncbi:hypothetical protein ABOM_011033 [Aspergillus bombycis]|uniref:Heterokaryon incompatibility domain-containing protein n=1 Tax=Aspergillus bombycis TaxID=109264 RepID=A0A1F7ZMQ8_9EURO|nr:hypothetical protein ABOM_011033 [Aspergillus bombycis]OGM40740.1 hypothetical protein ABOM_011033 [Aspergillus bombycis]
MIEQFEYDPLPEPTCVRLVSFVPQDDATRFPPLTEGEPLLQLSLSVVDLQDTPHYEALSYTWGSPFPPEDSRSTAYDDKNSQRLVIVNGREHEIGRNLWEFLHQQQQTNANLGKEAAEMLAAGLDTYGRTPLMRAVIDRRLDLTEALLALGADTEQRDNEGKSALHYAVTSDILSVDLAQMLVYHGADIYADTQEGKTPLDDVKDEVAELIKSLSKDLGGKTLPRGLRLSTHRPMWIDSISINQKDTTERNMQVALMSDIYSKAMSVVVWLGVEGEPIPLALGPLSRHFIHWIGFTAVRDSGLTGLSLGNVLKQRYSIQDILETLAFEKLMARTWWSRTWVIQELTLAKRTLITCGSLTTHPMETAVILNLLCYIPSPGVIELPGCEPFGDITALFESARFSGVRGIEALMLADIGFRASVHTGQRELLIKDVLKLSEAVPNVSWGRRLSLQNLGRLGWWSQCSDPRDKVFGLVGMACPDPRDQGIVVDYDIPTDKVFIRYGHLFMQGSAEPIQDLYTGESYFFEPLEGLSYVQDTPNPHPEFQDYKAKLPSWTPNFSAHLTTCRIWSRKHSATSGMPNSPAIVSHPDPRILCVNGHIVDRVVAIERAHNKGDVHESEVLAWLKFIRDLDPEGGSRVDALRQTLTAGNQVQNKKVARKAFRDFIASKLCQSQTDLELESVIAQLRISNPRDTLPSLKALQKQKRERRKYKQEVLTLVLKQLKKVEELQGELRGLQDKVQGLLKLQQGLEKQKQELLKLEQDIRNQEYVLPEQRQASRDLLRGFMELLPELRQREHLQVEPGLMYLTLEEMRKRMVDELQLSPPDYTQLRAFHTLLRRYNRSRCLFRTTKGYIGLGPVGVQPGDEVWLFATARTPFVLRRPSEGSLRRETRGSNSSTAEGECRVFIGETYVHGIMNGEAMQKGDFRPVALV